MSPGETRDRKPAGDRSRHVPTPCLASVGSISDPTLPSWHGKHFFPLTHEHKMIDRCTSKQNRLSTPFIEFLNRSVASLVQPFLVLRPKYLGSSGLGEKRYKLSSHRGLNDFGQPTTKNAGCETLPLFPISPRRLPISSSLFSRFRQPPIPHPHLPRPKRIPSPSPACFGPHRRRMAVPG